MTPCQTDPVLTHLRRFALHQGGRTTDAQLLEAFLARHDEAAFEELVRRHGPMVLGVCRRALADPHDAEDAFQATFLVLARRAADVVPASRVGPWLYGVARRTAWKARSSAMRRRGAERAVALDRPRDQAAAGCGDDLLPVIDEELGRLPEKYRAPLVLCLLQERSRKEAAGLLGWTEGTLSGRLARAKEMLGARLTRRGVSLAGVALPAEVPPALTAAAVSRTVSTTAVALTEEVLKPMLLLKMKTIVGALALAAGVGLGSGAVAYRPRPAAPPEAKPPSPEKKAKFLPFVIEPPDMLSIRHGSEAATLSLVRPDGTITLASGGVIHVAGLTIEEARRAIADHLSAKVAGFDREKLRIDWMNYSKFYHLVFDGDGGSEQVAKMSCFGNETILDAVNRIPGMPAAASLKKVWISRPGPGGKPETILPVDWHGLSQRGETATNYQLLPGDRVYVKSDGPREAANPDPVSELEAAVKALREGRSHEEQRRAFDALDAATKRLRQRQR
ncbi:MAG: sigma-70 family RNA polymerase sigma factor [Gemmataceae bacterium]